MLTLLNDFLSIYWLLIVSMAFQIMLTRFLLGGAWHTGAMGWLAQMFVIFFFGSLAGVRWHNAGIAALVWVFMILAYMLASAWGKLSADAARAHRLPLQITSVEGA